jgi:YaiO family outer membrane protein
MRARAAAFALALAALPGHAPGADGASGPRSSEFELGASNERLTGGRPDWRSLTLEGAHSFAARHTLVGGVRETERFGLRDTEQWLGYSHPLDAAWTSLLEASVSQQHQVLPRHSVFGQLAKQLGAGWGASLGLRHSEYNLSGVNLLVAGAERYWGSYRGAYTLYAGHPEGAGTGVAHRLQLDYYYGERSAIGVSVAAGREVENLGPPTGIVTTEVHNLSLAGRHWMTPEWALSWELLAHEQGDLYRRQGIKLGVRRRF